MKQTNDSGSDRRRTRQDAMRIVDEATLHRLGVEVELAKVKVELAEERWRHFETLMRESELYWRE